MAASVGFVSGGVVEVGNGGGWYGGSTINDVVEVVSDFSTFFLDIDECKEIVPSPCIGKCENLPGWYHCYCSKGSVGDGRRDGTGCRPSNTLWIALGKLPLLQETGNYSLNEIILFSRASHFFFPLWQNFNQYAGTSMSLLVLLIGSSWIYRMSMNRKLNKERQKFFNLNGGLYLLQLLSQQRGDVEKTRIFTAKDLKKATNNYNETTVLGHGAHGTVYNGVLPDKKEVAIKKPNISDQKQVREFINELVILSQINHDNVVKLLGCCLETKFPILVYEFIINGTLYDHIHERRGSSLLWESRLKIAVEAAQAVTYLHSLDIVHRDIKTTNILLENNYTAKVADFGASRLIPTDKPHVTTLGGTVGYIDPEYFRSNQLTKKSDVYSFGVVLAELLTGEEVISSERTTEDRNLAGYFVSWTNDDRLPRVVDKRLSKDIKIETFEKFAKLVKVCLNLKGEDRPTMEQVEIELKSLMSTIEKHPSEDAEASTKVSEDVRKQIVPSRTER
ncbi:hypothetical protein RJ639_018300, partial [Escallonia herrerae]